MKVKFTKKRIRLPHHIFVQQRKLKGTIEIFVRDTVVNIESIQKSSNLSVIEARLTLYTVLSPSEAEQPPATLFPIS